LYSLYLPIFTGIISVNRAFLVADVGDILNNLLSFLLRFPETLRCAAVSPTCSLLNDLAALTYLLLGEELFPRPPMFSGNCSFRGGFRSN